MADKGVCTVAGCDKPQRGVTTLYCDPHYRRNLKYGDPLAGGTYKGAPSAWIDAHVGHSHSDCLIWPFAKLKNGYASIHVGKSMTTVSRVICEKAHGAPPSPWYEAAHSCGAGHLGCVNPTHLSWKTPSDNRADKRQHGTDNRGSRNYRSKLTEEQVLEIRAMQGTEKVSTIAALYGVKPNVVSQIMSRAVWAWL